jgi:hypothetical protein
LRKKIDFELFAPPTRGWQAGKLGSLKLPKVSQPSSILAFQLPGHLIPRNGANFTQSGCLNGF